MNRSGRQGMPLKATVCFALLVCLLFSPSLFARNLEIGVWSPGWMALTDGSSKIKSRTGGGLTVIFPSSFGIGFDQVGANIVPTDPSSDAPQLKHSLVNFSFTMPRKEAMDITIGFGLGNVAYSCTTCAANYLSGKSSQIFIEGRGGFWGLEWAWGLRKISGLIKGAILGPGQKVADKNAGMTAASLGVGLGFK